MEKGIFQHPLFSLLDCDHEPGSCRERTSSGFSANHAFFVLIWTKRGSSQHMTSSIFNSNNDND